MRVSFLGFTIVGGSMVFVIELLDRAIVNSEMEQRKLDLVLKAASAATWEMCPDRRLHWDDNFYRLMGLEREGNPPSTDRFLAMIHPEDRAALREARDLLVKGGGNEADLRTLLLSQLDGFAVAERMEAEGMALKISSNATQYLAMAFHQLSTNAIKYGAFSNAEGRVKVTWKVTGDAAKTFNIEWRESGGPKPEGYSDCGFGSKVLTRLTPSALMGHAEVMADEGGLIWRLEAPLDALLSKPRS